jgi:phosphonate transport system ATP-binding protein
LSAAPAALIEARGLQVRAGSHVLLRDIGITISQGERVALVGHNGAGKSTLLRSLTGFADVSRGSLRVLDTELSSQPNPTTLRQLRSRVAQVHQGLYLIGRWSGLDNVLIGGSARSRSPWNWLRRWPADEQDAAHAALSRVDMAWAARRRTDSLSGGERQKIAIARALHQRAPVLLADEPTASLDAAAADDVIELLRDVVAERKSTLVCVVHDLELLPRLADRVIALRKGVIIADMAVTPRTPGQLRHLL